MNLWRQILRQGLLFSTALMLLLICLYLQISPLRSPGSGLDPSWMRVLDLAYSERWQFGRDIVFTYGPLGFLGNVLITSENLLVWGAATALVGILWFSFFFLISRQYVWQLPAALMVFLIAAPLAYFGADSAFLCLPFFAFVLARGDQRRPAALMFLAAAVFGHVKLTFGVATLVLAVLADIGRRPYCTLCAVIGFLLAYLCAGQSLEYLGDYMYFSLQMISGYTGAMAVYGDPNQVYAYLTLCAALIVGCWCLPGARPDRVIRCLGFAFVCFIIFKSNYVRHTDLRSTYAIAQLGLVATAVFLAASQSTRMPRGYTVLVAVVAAVWTSATLYSAPLERFHRSSPVNAAAGFVQRKVSLPILSLTKLRDGRVRRRPDNLGALDGMPPSTTLDVLNWNSALALDSTFQFRPRPVFQSYAAYSMPLARKNLDAFLSAPPDVVLYSAQTIGDRWPGMADSLLLPVFIQRYAVAGQTKHGVVLTRRDSGRDCSVERSSATGTFNQEFAAQIDDDLSLVILSVDTSQSVASRLRTLVFKPPVYRLEGRVGGRSVKSRAAPLEMIRVGVPVFPEILRQSEAAAFENPDGRRFDSFRLVAEDDIMPPLKTFQYTFTSYRCPPWAAASSP